MILVTGAAGFIGSHITERLVKKDKIRVVDLPEANARHIEPYIKMKKVELIRRDLSLSADGIMKGIDTVYHMAAFPLVKMDEDSPKKLFENNVRATFNVLEECRKNDVKKIIFASTSTVYGNAKIPTPETEQMSPVSLYGASKVAGEVLIKSYCETYGMTGVVFRLANIFGPRSTHGVMHDFFFKLNKNPEQLEILGDGKQKKSYIYIDDCVDAFVDIQKKIKSGFDVFNVGSDEQTSVTEIANMMLDMLNLKYVKLKYTGGRLGWKGDVPVMLLDTKKIKSAGWKQKVSFEAGMKNYINWMKKEHGFVV